MFVLSVVISLLMRICSGGGESEELEVVGGGDFYGGGQQAGELDEEALFGCAARFQEGAFVAVQGSGTDDAHPFAVHGGGELFGPVVAGRLDVFGGCYEAFHVGRRHGHGRAVGRSFDVTVLERFGAVYDFVKRCLFGVYEEQVAHEGGADAALFAALRHYLYGHGCEDAEAGVCKLPVGGEFGVGSLQIPHYIPLGGGCRQVGCGFHLYPLVRVARLGFRQYFLFLQVLSLCCNSSSCVWLCGEFRYFRLSYQCGLTS